MIVGLFQIKKKGEKGYPTMVRNFWGYFVVFKSSRINLKFPRSIRTVSQFLNSLLLFIL